MKNEKMIDPAILPEAENGGLKRLERISGGDFFKSGDLDYAAIKGELKADSSGKMPNVMAKDGTLVYLDEAEVCQPGAFFPFDEDNYNFYLRINPDSAQSGPNGGAPNSILITGNEGKPVYLPPEAEKTKIEKSWGL